MSKVVTFNTEDIFTASYSKDMEGCHFRLSEHALLYVARGSMKVMIDGMVVSAVKENECVFIRKDHRVSIEKHPSPEMGYHVSVMLFFPRGLLFDFYKSLSHANIPDNICRSKKTVLKIRQSPMLVSLFDSFKPYWEIGCRPEKGWLDIKVREAIHLVLHTDVKTYASLFDFTDRWRPDILDFMQHNYMYDLTIEDLAHYTGRSLSTFKRDFKKLSEISPRNWIMRRHLQVAQELIMSTERSIVQIMSDVGFKNFSHFCRAYRKHFGCSPSKSRDTQTSEN